MTYYVLSKRVRGDSVEYDWFNGCILSAIDHQSDEDCVCITYAKYDDYISRHPFEEINCRGWYIARSNLKKVIIK